MTKEEQEVLDAVVIYTAAYAEYDNLNEAGHVEEAREALQRMVPAHDRMLAKTRQMMSIRTEHREHS